MRQQRARGASPQKKGQTLVLFALLMLLLVLMVCITLNVGMRTRERMELQLATDAAAQTQAVLVARVLNQGAIMSRAAYAHIAAAAGAQSLISWSGHSRSNLSSLRDALGDLEQQYDGAAGCNPERDAVRDAIAVIDGEGARISAGWAAKDEAAARDVLAMMGNVTALRNRMKNEWGTGLYDALMCRHIVGQQAVRDVAKLASPELQVRAQGADKSIDELAVRHCGNRQVYDAMGCPTGAAPGQSSLCEIGGSTNAMSAPMGTRDPFAYGRVDAAPLMKAWLQSLLAPVNPRAVVTPAAGVGGSGFGDREGGQVVTGLAGWDFWAEDHGGTLTLVWPPVRRCGQRTSRMPVQDSWVESNDSTLNDSHVYSPANDSAAELSWHDFGACNVCPNMYPAFFDFDPQAVASGEPNDYGQPKLYAMVERDYGARARRAPWDLFFKFRFSAGASFGAGRSGDVQAALGSSIAYYHRPGAWQEPPNLMNPFWRATLAAPDRDAPQRLVAAGYTEGGEALHGLRTVGFRGVPP